MAIRGPDAMQESLFTVATLDDFVPADHPLRAIRTLVNDALTAMNAQFNAIYADSGRDSVAQPYNREDVPRQAGSRLSSQTLGI